MRAFAVFAGMLLLAWVALVVLPKMYHSEIKIQAQRNQVISTLAGLDRSWDFDTPTRAASDLVLRTDNLVSLVRKTNLIAAWYANRAPIQKLKDTLLRAVRKPMTGEDQENMLVGTLEKQLSVVTADETVTIEVDWWDALTTFRLTVAAYENFLEARQFKEISAISEAIGILESRAGEEREKVNASVDRVLQLRGPVQTKGTAAPPAGVVVRRPPPPMDAEVQRLRGALQAKQQAVSELEEFRRRRIAELESKMAGLQQVYSEFHPEVVDLRETIRQQQATVPPQLLALREEYRRLEKDYQQHGGPAFDAQKANSRGTALPVEALRLTQTLADVVEQPEIEQAKNELRYQVGRYLSLVERIDAVKLEHETQRAAFRYRYDVLRPASMPLAPAKPKAAPVLIAAGLVGVLLGIAAAVITDLRSRRIYQRWQVERLLELPVLAEVKLP
jgi:uncharacterized protein involved in exopolysaccharide biosynthesis